MKIKKGSRTRSTCSAKILKRTIRKGLFLKLKEISQINKINNEKCEIELKLKKKIYKNRGSQRRLSNWRKHYHCRDLEFVQI